MNLQASIDLHCVVVKQRNEYCVKSEDRSKNLGCKPSKEGAKRRLRQVEYFKHLKGGGQGSGRHRRAGIKGPRDGSTKRDYKTEERRAWKNLAKHKEIMDRLMKEGLSRNEASSRALKEMNMGGPGSGRKKGSSKKKWSQMTEEERRQAAAKDPRQIGLFQ
jgi:hypothetical protein